MPITDPRMNPSESTWGILYDVKFGFCQYLKSVAGAVSKNSDLRYCCQGTEVNVQSATKLAEPFTWNGIQILQQAIGVAPDVNATGPVYQMLNKMMKDIFFTSTGSARTLSDVQAQLSKYQNVNGQPVDGADFTSDFNLG